MNKVIFINEDHYLRDDLETDDSGYGFKKDDLGGEDYYDVTMLEGKEPPFEYEDIKIRRKTNE